MRNRERLRSRRPRGAQQPHNWWAMAIAIVLVNLTVVLGFIYWTSRDGGTPRHRSAQPETQPVRSGRHRPGRDGSRTARRRHSHASRQSPAHASARRGQPAVGRGQRSADRNSAATQSPVERYARIRRPDSSARHPSSCHHLHRTPAIFRH